MTRKRLFLFCLTGFTLGLVFLILTDVWPYLRGPAPETPEWYWFYKLRPFSRWWLPLLATLGMWGVTIWWLTTKRWQIGLVALIVGSVVLQWGLVYAEKPAVLTEMIERTLSHQTDGYFVPAAETADLSALLRDYPALMPTFFSEHTRTHPPGLLVANWLLLQTFARLPRLSQTLAERVWPLRCTDLWLLERPPHVAAALAASTVLSSFISALTLLPAYGLASRLLPDRAARLATALTATLPASLVFTPSSVQVDVLLAVTAVFCLQLGLESRNRGWFFLSGLVLSLATFFNLGNAAWLVLLVGYALFWWYVQGDVSVFSIQYSVFSSLLALGVGMVVIWLMYWWGWGVTPWLVVQTGLAQHYELVTLHRRYDWWLVYNLVDVLVFAGPVVVVGFLGMIFREGREAGSEGRGARSESPFAFRPSRLVLKKPKAERDSSRVFADRFTAVRALTLILAFFILLLDISGSTRGEVGRLWFFLMPFLAISSAAFWQPTSVGARRVGMDLGAIKEVTSHPPRPYIFKRDVLIIGLQLLIALSLALAWQPVLAVIVVAERPNMPTTSPETALHIPYHEPNRDENSLTLTGYDLEQTATTLNLTLYWQATQPAIRPYTVFTHLVNDKGELAAQQDNWPVNGLWPPTCWQPGETVIDPYQFSLEGLPPGGYTLQIGWYDARDGTRLQTENGRDIIAISQIVISP